MEPAELDCAFRHTRSVELRLKCLLSILSSCIQIAALERRKFRNNKYLFYCGRLMYVVCMLASPLNFKWARRPGAYNDKRKIR